MPDRCHLRRLICAAVATLAALVVGPGSAVAGRQTEPVYLDGHTVEINTGAGLIFDATTALLDQAVTDPHHRLPGRA